MGRAADRKQDETDLGIMFLTGWNSAAFQPRRAELTAARA
jgi:hypothetical protein